MFLPPFASRLYWPRFLARNARPWAAVEAFPALNPEARRLSLAQALHSQIAYFGRREDALPEWREASRIADPLELWRVWPSLPAVGKKDLQERFIASEMQDRFGIEGKVDASGGSTGEPVRFLHDTAMLRTNMALSIYTRIQMGWRPGMATVIVWGSERDIGKSLGWKNQLQLQFLRDDLVDGYHLTGATVDRVLARIRQHGECAVFGFTSMLEYVARTVIERGVAIPQGAVRTAWNGGEALFAEQSELFRRAFGVPILNRYGGREMSDMACQSVSTGPLRIMRPWVFLEVVDERNQPVSPGETGRLLCTSTVCRGTPFLRYEVGDLATFAAADWDESGVGALTAVEGRVSELMELPDGRRISPLYWNHLAKEFPEVRAFQVRISPGRLRLLLAGKGDPPISPARGAEMEFRIRSLIGSMPYSVEWVAEIPRTAQGKLVQVVRESV